MYIHIHIFLLYIDIPVSLCVSLSDSSPSLLQMQHATSISPEEQVYTPYAQPQPAEQG